MGKKVKISAENVGPSPKKLKKSETNESTISDGNKKIKKSKRKEDSAQSNGTGEPVSAVKSKTSKTPKKSFEKPIKPSKKSTSVKEPVKGKLFKSTKPGQKAGNLQEKPEDWNEFKKKKKELKVKRKQTKEGFEVVLKAKALADKIQRKSCNASERQNMVDELHEMLKGNYAKFALAHDSSRIVQVALKYGSIPVRGEISKEVLGIVVEMTTSKYGRHIVRRLLKHGEPEVRQAVVDGMYGSAVRLASHVISAPTLEYAYSMRATPRQRRHLLQEFFSEMYKHSKDDQVKCLADTYKSSPDLKSGILSAVKENLSRIITKGLFDSQLVHSVLRQFLQECSAEQRAEMVAQVMPHVVVLSNSRDGARAAMQCIWHGTNKDRKVAIKALKQHIIELCKHEHAHCTIITFLDAADDTVLLHKVLLGEILKSARDLAADEWGRKVLLWLVAPGDSLYFHPTFVKELEAGRAEATSKKPVETRRKEILQYASGPLTELVREDPGFWLSKPSLAVEMLGIVKAGSGDDLKETYKSIVEVICDPAWQIKDQGQDFPGIEHSGIHMTLKKLAQHDKVRSESGEHTFGACLVENLSDNVISQWIKCNRGCFLLVTVFENSPPEVQELLKAKLQSYKKKIKAQTGAGFKILLKKLA